MNSFEWTTAHDVAEAAKSGASVVAEAMVSQTGTPAKDAVVLKAGGIDLLDLMKEGLLTPRRLVNLRQLADLDRITEADNGVRIGAMVTLAEIARHSAIRSRYAALAAAAEAAASPQLRAMATIGGNLLQRPRCWYFRSAEFHCARKGGAACFAFAGDNRYHAIFGHNGCAIVHPSTPATALVAFGARVELTANGGKRVVDLESFFVPPEVDLHRETDIRPGEVLTTVALPAVTQSTRSAHLKQAEKAAFDWPTADVAVVLDRDREGICRRASVVLGAAAPTPHRARAAEQELLGQPISDEIAARAAHAALNGAVPLSDNGYKLPIFEALVRRALLAAVSS